MKLPTTPELARDIAALMYGEMMRADDDPRRGAYKTRRTPDPDTLPREAL